MPHELLVSTFDHHSDWIILSHSSKAKCSRFVQGAGAVTAMVRQDHRENPPERIIEEGIWLDRFWLITGMQQLKPCWDQQCSSNCELGDDVSGSRFWLWLLFCAEN